MDLTSLSRSRKRRDERQIHRAQPPKIMPLHLIKLAVGCESVKELKGWVAERMKTAKKKGQPQRHIHITRMTPKRVDEILAGGSLYWVIRGEIAAREKIVASSRSATRTGSADAGW